jgi:hypothetical protein
MDLSAVLEHLDSVKRTTAGGYIARCPAHDDRHPTLAIDAGAEGRILIRCFAGCPTADIVHALGLEMSDLFVSRAEPHVKASRNGTGPRPARDVRATFEFVCRNRAGEAQAIHVRREYADGKDYSWKLPDGRSGLAGRPTSDLPLYAIERLPADLGARIVVTEGEKAAESLLARGIPAVATVTGAGNPIPTAAVLADLAERHVVLWADADEPGRQHMDELGRRLSRIGPASLYVVVWPDAPAKGDAADFPGDPWDLIDVAEPFRGAQPWRTLADISDEPPEALLLGMLEPAGPTLLYAAPGTGKGMTGAWTIHELQALGRRPLIYDAERREREWSRRVSGLGGDRSRVVYVTPAELGAKFAGKPLWDAATALADAIGDTGSDVLIIDSVLPAIGLGEERLKSDAAAPFLYVDALEQLGVPSLSFGHPPKGQPEGDPFGSFAWVAAMRLTWLGTRAEGDGHRVRWRPRKRNERGFVPGVLLTFSYDDASRLVGVVREDDDLATREWLLAQLVDGPQAVADLADRLLELEEEAPTETVVARAKDKLRHVLQRLAREELVQRLGEAGSRNARWALVEP